MDLAEFLKARLDEDEAAAKDERVWFGPHPETIKEWEGWLVIQEDRVLREVAAKRAILDLHDGSHECSSYSEVMHDFDNCAWISDGSVCSTLRHLAAIYSDRPDYDPEWKP